MIYTEDGFSPAPTSTFEHFAINSMWEKGGGEKIANLWLD